MTKQYGFMDYEYENGRKIQTLVTGDGKTMFLDLEFLDGDVGIGINYGLGQGVKIPHPDIRSDDPLFGIHWQIIFESVGSIDSMIKTLNRLKDKLVRIESEKNQSFYNWVITQKDRNDVVGDLALDISMDESFPKTSSDFPGLYLYIKKCGACMEALQAFTTAYNEFEEVRKG